MHVDEKYGHVVHLINFLKTGDNKIRLFEIESYYEFSFKEMAGKIKVNTFFDLISTVQTLIKRKVFDSVVRLRDLDSGCCYVIESNKGTCTKVFEVDVDDCEDIVFYTPM